jgi:hypothetical protein
MVFPWETPMITSTVTVLLLIALGTGGAGHSDFAPNITYYAPCPWWFPQYFGPPHSDYLTVQYVTPPAETAAIVKQRIRSLHAANPALWSAPKELLPPPKPTHLPLPQK